MSPQFLPPNKGNTLLTKAQPVRRQAQATQLFGLIKRLWGQEQPVPNQGQPFSGHRLKYR